MHGMYGSMDAAFEVQRTIKRAELTAFFVSSQKKLLALRRCMSITRGSLMGCGKEEGHASIRKAGDAGLWIKIWEELHLSTPKELLVEVEHVKAHRTGKDEKEMSHFEKFVTEGNEKADELAKEGALLDEGFMAQTRAKTVKQEREEVHSLAVCGQFSLSGRGLERLCRAQVAAERKVGFCGQEGKEARHQTEWCANDSKYRCMRCGKGSKWMKIQGECSGPKYLSKCLGKWVTRDREWDQN